MTESTNPTTGYVDLSDLVATDTAVLEIMKPGGVEPSGWEVTFAGPDHPQTVESVRRLQRRSMNEQRILEQQRANGRRVKIDEKDPDEENRKAVTSIVERIVTWTPIRIGGVTHEFNPKAAVDLLMKPSMLWAFSQMAEFLANEKSFLPTSANN